MEEKLETVSFLEEDNTLGIGQNEVDLVLSDALPKPTHDVSLKKLAWLCTAQANNPNTKITIPVTRLRVPDKLTF